MRLIVIAALLTACTSTAPQTAPDAGATDASAADAAPADATAQATPDAEWGDECVTVDDCLPHWDDCVRGLCMYVEEPDYGDAGVTSPDEACSVIGQELWSMRRSCGRQSAAPVCDETGPVPESDVEACLDALERMPCDELLAEPLEWPGACEM